MVYLEFADTAVTDLEPLRGMPLQELYFHSTPVTDVSPLAGAPLRKLVFSPRQVTKGLEVLRAMETLRELGPNPQQMLPAAEFWKRYDAGEFGKAPGK